MKKINLIQRLIKRAKKKEHKYINGTKGVISIFLAILMVPFVTIAGALINSARINSAVAIFDEALCNASNSTLGTYDSFLKSRFGLLAMSQDVSGSGEPLNQYTVSDFISETFEFYMEQNLKSLNNTYLSFESESTGVYPLSNTDILLSQVLEYSKYSVPTKLAIDGLGVNDLISKLENMIPGMDVFNMITSGTKVVDNMVALAEDYELLKDAVAEEETALSNYNTAYNSFSSTVNGYLNKKAEMQTVLANLQNVIDQEYAKVSGIINQIESYESQIAQLQQAQSSSGTDNSSQISQLQTQLANYRSEHSAELEPWETAKSNYNTTKASYEQAIAELYNAIPKKKSDYSSKIFTLISKLKNTKNKLTTVQQDILNMGNSVAGLASTATSQAIDKTIKETEDKIKKIDEQLAATTDESQKKALEEQKSILQKETQNLQNQKKVNSAQKAGYESATNKMSESISKINTESYTEIVNTLTTLKAKVDSFDTTNVTSKVTKSDYYVEVVTILDSATVKKAEDDLVGECAEASIWSLIKMILGFFEALFSATTVYNPNLRAVIDTEYYNTNYGGLPAAKDRTAYPLSMGEAGDAELSAYYKELLGDYSANGGVTEGSIDVIGTLTQIFTDVGTISSNVAAIIGIVGLLNLSDRLKQITDAADRIVANLKTILKFITNLIQSIGNKIILTGYVSYNTSNRTNYTKSGLTGSSFNMRAQIVPTGFTGGTVSSFLALIDSFKKAASGGAEKCFYGAETEYIIFGSTSELANQSAVFAFTYLIRLVANIGPVLSNPEVQSIAAACTIGAPIVNLLYILIEPLIDTIVLVNSGNVPILKNLIYLTPSGLSTLIKKFTTLKLSTATVEQMKVDLLDSIGQTSYADQYAAFGSGATNLSDETFWDINYSQNLFLIMTICVKSETILKRLSNLIQMEACEYMINKGMGSNGLFDLDYSYTYIRTKASFTTNEFISISDTGTGLNAKERIIYRGY